jgi:hypothetical protein
MIEWVVLDGNTMVSKLVLIYKRVSEFVAKPQSLVDNQNKSLSTCLTSVRSCASNNWHILFTIALFGAVGGDITNPSSQVHNEKRQDQKEQKKLKTNKNQ